MSEKKPDISRLAATGLEQAGPRLWVRGAPEDLKRRIARADMFVSDFDECMHRSITQGEAGIRVYRRIASSLHEPGHLPLFFHISRHAVPIAATMAWQELTGDVLNSRMIRMFERLARGIPMSYFEDAIGGMYDDFFPGAADVLRLLHSRGVPAGVISLGLAPIVGGLLRSLEEHEGAPAAFYECTRIIEDSRGRFLRYNPDRVYTANHDKKKMLEKRAAQFDARRPLVVGHDRDDEVMFHTCRAMGGVNIGFRPVKEVLPMLDAAVYAPDWRPIHRLLSGAFEEEAAIG